MRAKKGLNLKDDFNNVLEIIFYLIIIVLTQATIGAQL